jgi:hypothetical protein
MRESGGRYEQIWAAGGTPHTVFPTTFKELLALTGGVAMHPAGDAGRRRIIRLRPLPDWTRD